MPTVHGQPAKRLLHGWECRRLGLGLDQFGAKPDASHNSVEHQLRSFLVHPRPVLVFRPMAASFINGFTECWLTGHSSRRLLPESFQSHPAPVDRDRKLLLNSLFKIVTAFLNLR